ncbi:MAG: putative branched-chain amino acid transport system [Acidimicrobiia bacterium]|nr:putative branched-chain amino acid transport system [Acidimicrobiia bacterium]
MARFDTRRNGRWRPLMLGVGLVTVGLVASACSSDDSKSSSAPATSATAGGSGAGTAGGAAATTTSDASSVLGTPKPATGTPVKIGFITEGKQQAIDNSSEVPAAQAAAKYANDYLGGIGGHPIVLDVCDDKQTPSGTTDCDNQMIADKVPIVLNNVTGNGDPLIKNISAAGIPLMAYQSSVQSIITSPNAYVLTNGLGAVFAGPAKIAQNNGYKRGAIFVIDVPAAADPVKQLYPLIWKNAGNIGIDIVAIAPGTADMTPQVQAELSKSPDLVQVLGDVTFCSSALKALKTLGYSKTIAIIAQCVTSTSAAGIPGGYKGMQETTVYSTDPSDAENKLYKAAMTKYAPSTDPYANGVTSGGWGVTLGLARALAGLQGEVTTANIKTTLAAMPPTPVPLGGGVTFQCTGKQIAITPAVCATGALQATLNQAGQPDGGFKPLDVVDLLKLG